jgi:hypothetical protein
MSWLSAALLAAGWRTWFDTRRPRAYECMDGSRPGNHFTAVRDTFGDELHRQVKVQQEPECFTGHRAGNHIAPDYNVIDAGLTNLVEDSFQRGKVSMNIVQPSNAHNRPLALSSEMARCPAPGIRGAESLS